MRFILVFIVCINSFLYSQPKKNIDSVTVYKQLANANIKINKYGNAIFYTQKAINYALVNHDAKAQAKQTYKLGKIYYDLKKYDEAIVAFNRCINLYQSLPADFTTSFANYYLGKSSIEKKNYVLAGICFAKVKAINKTLKFTQHPEILDLQIGVVYKIKGDYAKAASMFKIIIDMPDSLAYSTTKSEAYYQLGTINTANGDNVLASKNLQQSLKLNNKDIDLDQKSNTFLQLSTVFGKMADTIKAYHYLTQHLKLKDSLSVLNNEKFRLNDYDKIKNDQQLKAIANMNKEKKQQEKANKYSKLISILAIALISILSLLSLSLYKNNIIRNQSNLILKDKNKELEIAKDKAEKASKARSEFLSTVSHELRTPLNAINGITHLLLEENPKPSQMEYLNSLEFSGKYLLTFINEMLEINRIESNTILAEKISFNLKKLLENIQNSLKELATANNNNFSLDIDAAIPDNLIGDPIKLSQIFMNLIYNALKFTKKGDVIVFTKLNSLQNNKATIYFEVKDNGIGIHEEKLETIFDSFSQGSIEINRKYGGTGLGLTIVKKLVEILGGKIKLNSVLGKGSSFSFELQFDVDSKPIPLEIKPKYNENNLKNKKILVVEDNKINQMITKKMLENKKISCEIIDNGEDAIEIAKNNTYDLILMDVHLPGINGTIATQQIRKFDKKTPIIAITAISLNENREMLISFGMNDVITKPFAPADFYAVIAKYI